MTRPRTHAGMATVLGALLCSVPYSDDFPARVVRQLAELRAGVTPATWLAAHPADRFARFARNLVREHDERWCARASFTDTVATGARFVRYAYFYPPPPPPPPSLMLPPGDGATLVRDQCILGTIWVERAVPDSAAGSTLAVQLREALTRAYGPVRAAPDAFFGRVPTDSQRKLMARLPNADAMLLGVHFFGAAAWRVPGRWQLDSTVVVSALDVGLGARPRVPGQGRVLAFAFLPVAELGSFDWVARREEAVDRNAAALAAEAARLSGINRRQVDRLLGILAAAESAYSARAPTRPVALDSAAVAALRDWIASARTLDAPHRAAALLAADQVLGSRALIYVRAQREDSATRMALQRVGAAFIYDELGGGYNYAHTWLDEALRLDPHGRAGTLATLALLRSGFNETGMCGGGADAFRKVIETGEQFLAGAVDSAAGAEVHLLVGDAYADIVALASGAGLEYADSAAYAAEAPEARRKAITHYRQGLALDPTSLEAGAAWLEAWRLLAGLPPTTTHFFCVYD